MADIKWIKIVTDIFDDEKILLIETLPEADSIIVIWFKLLCLAGKQNNSGVFTLNGKIPYTDKMLATIFRRKETIVTLALHTFEQFGMIEIINDTITIPNWGKHQNFDKIEAKTEYMKSYMREYRQKQICKANSKTNSKANVSSADKIRLDKIRLDKINIDKKFYGENQKVFFTDEQYEKLKIDFPKDYEDRIQRLDDYMSSKGVKYKDCLATIRNWARKEGYKFPSKDTKAEKKAEYVEIDTSNMSNEEYAELLKQEREKQEREELEKTKEIN